jgi:hypothetical protein
MWYNTGVKHELLEFSHAVPESDAVRFLVEPNNDTAPLVNLDSFEHTPTQFRVEPMSRTEFVYGRTELAGSLHPASIIVIMPNIFQRSIARIRGHEPRATVHITVSS